LKLPRDKFVSLAWAKVFLLRSLWHSEGTNVQTFVLYKTKAMCHIYIKVQ